MSWGTSKPENIIGEKNSQCTYFIFNKYKHLSLQVYLSG